MEIKTSTSTLTNLNQSEISNEIYNKFVSSDINTDVETTHTSPISMNKRINNC